MNLRETQRRFFELVTAPESVERTLEARGLPPSHVDEIVVGDARRSAVGRLEIYANMYFFRILEVLGQFYPALAAALGEERFHNLVTAYLEEHPSRDPSIRRVGDALPEAVETGWLRELARLERARLDCFDDADAEPLTLDEVRALDPAALAALPLEPVPAHRVLACRFAVDESWAQAEAGEPVSEPAESPRRILVWRRGGEVFHRALDDDEALGGSFGGLCERLPGAPEEAAQRAFALLARWLGDGLIRA